MYIFVTEESTLPDSPKSIVFNLWFRENSENEENSLLAQDEGQGEEVEAEKGVGEAPACNGLGL